VSHWCDACMRLGRACVTYGTAHGRRRLGVVRGVSTVGWFVDGDC
jgi:hypothetical protein